MRANSKRRISGGKKRGGEKFETFEENNESSLERGKKKPSLHIIMDVKFVSMIRSTVAERREREIGATKESIVGSRIENLIERGVLKEGGKVT